MLAIPGLSRTPTDRGADAREAIAREASPRRAIPEPDRQIDVFQDLDRVVLLVDVDALEGSTIKAGALGTVVGIWRGGEAYEVEFTAPVAGLATVKADALRDAHSDA